MLGLKKSVFAFFLIFILLLFSFVFNAADSSTLSNFTPVSDFSYSSNDSLFKPYATVFENECKDRGFEGACGINDDRFCENGNPQVCFIVGYYWNLPLYCNTQTDTCNSNEICVNPNDSQAYCDCRIKDLFYEYQCYSDDVYWYDNCGNRVSKKEECGSDSTEMICHGSDRVIQVKYGRGCSNGACFELGTTTTVGEYCDYPEYCMESSSGAYCGCKVNDTTDYYQCYKDDVYWYNNCGGRETKKEDCGYNTNERICSNGNVAEIGISRGCSGNTCYAQSSTSTIVEYCDSWEYCSNAKCNNGSISSISWNKSTVNVGDVVNLKITTSNIKDGTEIVVQINENDVIFDDKIYKETHIIQNGIVSINLAISSNMVDKLSMGEAYARAYVKNDSSIKATSTSLKIRKGSIVSASWNVSSVAPNTQVTLNVATQDVANGVQVKLEIYETDCFSGLEILPICTQPKATLYSTVNNNSATVYWTVPLIKDWVGSAELKFKAIIVGLSSKASEKLAVVCVASEIEKFCDGTVLKKNMLGANCKVNTVIIQDCYSKTTPNWDYSCIGNSLSKTRVIEEGFCSPVAKACEVKTYSDTTSTLTPCNDLICSVSEKACVSGCPSGDIVSLYWNKSFASVNDVVVANVNTCGLANGTKLILKFYENDVFLIGGRDDFVDYAELTVQNNHAELEWVVPYQDDVFFFKDMEYYFSVENGGKVKDSSDLKVKADGSWYGYWAEKVGTQYVKISDSKHYDQVYLVVVTNGLADNTPVELKIYEDDLFFDDDKKYYYSTNVVNNKAIFLWDVQYDEDSFSNAEYYFVAKIGNTKIRSKNNLGVSRNYEKEYENFGKIFSSGKVAFILPSESYNENTNIKQLKSLLVNNFGNVLTSDGERHLFNNYLANENLIRIRTYFNYKSLFTKSYLNDDVIIFVNGKSDSIIKEFFPKFAGSVPLSRIENEDNPWSKDERDRAILVNYADVGFDAAVLTLNQAIENKIWLQGYGDWSYLDNSGAILGSVPIVGDVVDALYVVGDCGSLLGKLPELLTPKYFSWRVLRNEAAVCGIDVGVLLVPFVGSKAIKKGVVDGAVKYQRLFKVMPNENFDEAGEWLFRNSDEAISFLNKIDNKTFEAFEQLLKKNDANLKNIVDAVGDSTLKSIPSQTRKDLFGSSLMWVAKNENGYAIKNLDFLKTKLDNIEYEKLNVAIGKLHSAELKSGKNVLSKFNLDLGDIENSGKVNEIIDDILDASNNILKKSDDDLIREINLVDKYVKKSGLSSNSVLLNYTSNSSFTEKLTVNWDKALINVATKNVSSDEAIFLVKHELSHAIFNIKYRAVTDYIGTSTTGNLAGNYAYFEPLVEIKNLRHMESFLDETDWLSALKLEMTDFDGPTIRTYIEDVLDRKNDPNFRTVLAGRITYLKALAKEFDDYATNPTLMNKLKNIGYYEKYVGFESMVNSVIKKHYSNENIVIELLENRKIDSLADEIFKTKNSLQHLNDLKRVEVLSRDIFDAVNARPSTNLGMFFAVGGLVGIPSIFTLVDVSGEADIYGCSYDSQCGSDVIIEKVCNSSGTALDIYKGEWDCVTNSNFNYCAYDLVIETISCANGCAPNSDKCYDSVIACYSNADCGASSSSSNFCKSDDVYKTNYSWDCVNAGTTSSFCKQNLVDVLVNDCSNGCENGSCKIVSNIACYSNVDCGVETSGNNFCSNGDVYKTVFTPTCNSAGTINSFCNNKSTNVLVQNCSNGCANGACLTDVPQEDYLFKDTFSDSVLSEYSLLTSGENRVFVSNNELKVLTGWDDGKISFTKNLIPYTNGRLKFSYSRHWEGNSSGKNYLVMALITDLGLEIGIKIPYKNVEFEGGILNSSATNPHPFVIGKSPYYSWAKFVDFEIVYSDSQLRFAVDNAERNTFIYGGNLGKIVGFVIKTDNISGTIDNLEFEKSNDEIKYSFENSTPDIACYSNADCGAVSYGNNYCSGGNVVRIVSSPLCVNSGTTSSRCSTSQNTQVIEVCSNGCANGVCSSSSNPGSNINMSTNNWDFEAFEKEGNFDLVLSYGNLWIRAGWGVESIQSSLPQKNNAKFSFSNKLQWSGNSNESSFSTYDLIMNNGNLLRLKIYNGATKPSLEYYNNSTGFSVKKTLDVSNFNINNWNNVDLIFNSGKAFVLINNKLVGELDTYVNSDKVSTFKIENTKLNTIFNKLSVETSDSAFSVPVSGELKDIEFSYKPGNWNLSVFDIEKVDMAELISSGLWLKAGWYSNSIINSFSGKYPESVVGGSNNNLYLSLDLKKQWSPSTSNKLRFEFEDLQKKKFVVILSEASDVSEVRIYSETGEQLKLQRQKNSKLVNVITSSTKNLEIILNGNKFYLYLNGEKVTEIWFDGFYFDNFSSFKIGVEKLNIIIDNLTFKTSKNSFTSGNTTIAPIACYSSSDCSTSSIGISSSKFCKNNDVYKTNYSWGCVNAGTASSFCKQNITDVLVEDCAYGCNDGSCLSNPVLSVACSIDSDCPSDSFKENICYADDKYEIIETWACLYPGKTWSKCVKNDIKKLVEDCVDGCDETTNECKNSSIENPGELIISAYGNYEFSSNKTGIFYVYEYTKYSATWKLVKSKSYAAGTNVSIRFYTISMGSSQFEVKGLGTTFARAVNLAEDSVSYKVIVE